MSPRPAPREAWMDFGLCTQTDPEIFFPEKGSSPRPAQRICGECPVRLRCLRYALENDEQQGVWGGTTPRERRQLRKRAA
jgi:WhiB family redox-sensing transcriptional regulator